MTLIVMLAIAYLPISFITFGGLHADMRASVVNTSIDSYVERRQTFAAAVLFSLFPLFWLLAPFMTGFFAHGWNIEWPTRRDSPGEGARQ